MPCARPSLPPWNEGVLSRCRFHTRQEARSVLFAYPEGFYNRRRRHSALGYLSSEEFERRWSANPESVSLTLSRFVDTLIKR